MGTQKGSQICLVSRISCFLIKAPKKACGLVRLCSNHISTIGDNGLRCSPQETAAQRGPCPLVCFSAVCLRECGWGVGPWLSVAQRCSGSRSTEWLDILIPFVGERRRQEDGNTTLESIMVGKANTPLAIHVRCADWLKVSLQGVTRPQFSLRIDSQTQPALSCMWTWQLSNHMHKACTLADAWLADYILGFQMMSYVSLHCCFLSHKCPMRCCAISLTQLY